MTSPMLMPDLSSLHSVKESSIARLCSQTISSRKICHCWSIPTGGQDTQKFFTQKAQWIANQGFAVLITDGRGTPHRSPAWEREILDDLSTAPVIDQADAVLALMALRPGLIDPARVAIRGWSFGGYLAGLAAMRRPDLFKAAIIGAPVTDFRLYDTFYTERFMGPDPKSPNYERASMLNDAKNLSVPVMIIHGMVDDNVLVSNSLQLSSALLEAGKAHEFLPLAGVTHMTPQEVVAENLMLLELDFLRRALHIN
jgi:dipeptidyl-peptidase-4